MEWQVPLKCYCLSLKLPSTWLHVPEDPDVIIYCHGNFRFHITIIAPLSYGAFQPTAIIVQDNM